MDTGSTQENGNDRDTTEVVLDIHSKEGKISNKTILQQMHQFDNVSTDSESIKRMSENTQDDNTPYHIFTMGQKRRLALIVSIVGLFNPLASNIYLPVLVTISKKLHVTVAQVSLSITVYMIIQGIVPSFWATLSDAVGRRSILIATFVVFLISNVALAFSNNLAMLLVYRGLQAAGSAATTSIGAGVIGDVSTAAERGGLIGIFGGIRMLAQSLGPVLGGILSQYYGFHSIFWFLVLSGAITLFLIIAFLPETLRSIAGNGSVRLEGIARPLIYVLKPQQGVKYEARRSEKKVTMGLFFDPLKFLFEIDAFISLFFGGIVYSVWNSMTASTDSQFGEQYHLSQVMLGICFMPNGLGCVFGSYLTGVVMDRDFAKTEREHRIAKSIPDSVKFDRKDLGDFPIERARLRSMWWNLLIFVVATSCYGYSLPLGIWAPLLLQFVISYTSTAISTLNSALIIDLYPGTAASAAAVNNLIRCSIGAIGVALIEHLIEATSPGAAFLILAGITIAFSPLIIVAWIRGPGWRAERNRKLRENREIEESAVSS